MTGAQRRTAMCNAMHAQHHKQQRHRLNRAATSTPNRDVTTSCTPPAQNSLVRGALRGALAEARRAHPHDLISLYERRSMRWVGIMARYGGDSSFGGACLVLIYRPGSHCCQA